MIRPDSFSDRAVNNQQIPVPGPGPNTGDAHKSDDEVRDEFVKTLLSNPDIIGKALQGGSGKSVKMEYKGEELLKITVEGPTMASGIIGGIKEGFGAARDAISLYSEQDPLLALRAACAGVQATVNLGIPESIVNLETNFFIPGVRAVTLAFDGRQALKTLKNKEASTLTKAVEVLHVGTDIAGLVGAVAPFFAHMAPGLANYSTPLLAASFAGDTITCGYRFLNFAQVTTHKEA